MKFSAVFAALALAGAVMAQSTTAPPSSVETTPPVNKKTLDCLKVCDDNEAGDVVCQAKCLGNPTPDEAMANDTTKCVGECEQGDGTEEQTAKYAACINKCIDTHFFSTVPSGSKPTGTAGSGDDSDDESSEGGNGTTNGDKDNKDSAAGTNTVIASFVGAFAIVAAAFAL